MTRVRRKWSLVGLLCASAVVEIAAGDAQAIVANTGQACVAEWTKVPLGYDTYGAYNDSSNGLFQYATCPLPLGTTGSSGCTGISNAVVRYRDNNPSQPYWCRAVQASFDGIIVYTGAARYTCSQAGGCPDPTASYVGTGYLQLNTPPSICMDQNFSIECGIPQPSGAYQQLSSVISYYAQ